MDAVGHAAQGEDHLDLLHVHELVDQQGEVGHELVRGHLGDDHVHAVDIVRLGILEQFAEIGDLLGGQFMGQEVGDDLDVHAL